MLVAILEVFLFLIGESARDHDSLDLTEIEQRVDSSLLVDVIWHDRCLRIYVFKDFDLLLKDVFKSLVAGNQRHA